MLKMRLVIVPLLLAALVLFASGAEFEHHRPPPPLPSAIEPDIPCVWSERQLIQWAPDNVWTYNEESASLPYKLCEMKLRHLATYHQHISDDNLKNWYNLSSEYLVFRLNRVLGKEYQYLTIPGAHDIVEHEVVDLLRMKCLKGYCNDYHVVMEECGGDLFGLEFIYSNFYYLHFSLYAKGLLRLRVCNTTVHTHGDGDWLDNLLRELAHADFREYHAHGSMSMRHHPDPDARYGRGLYIILIVIGVLLILWALFGVAFCLVGRRKRYYADPNVVRQ